MELEQQVKPRIVEELRAAGYEGLDEGHLLGGGAESLIVNGIGEKQQIGGPQPQLAAQGAGSGGPIRLVQMIEARVADQVD